MIHEPKEHPLVENAKAYLRRSSSGPMAGQPNITFVPLNRRLVAKHGKTLFPDASLYLPEEFIMSDTIYRTAKKFKTKYTFDMVGDIDPDKTEQYREELYTWLVDEMAREIGEIIEEHSWHREAVHPMIPILPVALVDPMTFEPFLSFMFQYGVSSSRK